MLLNDPDVLVWDGCPEKIDCKDQMALEALKDLGPQATTPRCPTTPVSSRAEPAAVQPTWAGALHGRFRSSRKDHCSKADSAYLSSGEGHAAFLAHRSGSSQTLTGGSSTQAPSPTSGESRAELILYCHIPAAPQPPLPQAGDPRAGEPHPAGVHRKTRCNTANIRVVLKSKNVFLILPYLCPTSRHKAWDSAGQPGITSDGKAYA